MDTYSALKAVHVLAAVTWVGGALTTNLLGSPVAATGDGPRLAAFGRDAAGILLTGSTWPCSCSSWSTWS